MKNTIYTVEIVCGYAEWWRYNIYLSVAEFDEEDRLADYRNVVDRIYDIEDGRGSEVRQAPAGINAAQRMISVETGACDHIAIYLYVIANTFPYSVRISDSPPFPMDFVVRRTSDNSSDGAEEILRHTCEVNQWGGATIAGLRIPMQERLSQHYF